MAYSAKILADSMAPCGARLITFEATYPRMVHSEAMTHRQLSRNAASSRAIPIAKMIEAVQNDPAMPVWWGKNQAGMQAREELTGEQLEAAKSEWLYARDRAVAHAMRLSATGLHKQIVNRVLEPWMWITVIISATEWENFFALRDHPDAQPEIAHVARMMNEARRASVPRRLLVGEWHTPMVNMDEFSDLLDADIDPCAVSVGRCARVSYLTHDGRRDLLEDVKLHDRLVGSTPPHMSPFEHVACALDTPARSGNYIGFRQYRKNFLNECIS